MPMRHPDARCGLLRFLAVAGVLLPALLPALLPVAASAASCKTQSQMPPEQRTALASTARVLLGEVQNGDVQALRQNTLPAVAADFSGIAATVDALKPFVGKATITVENLFALDSSTEF
jgi:anti-sigma factor RsiW